MMRKAARKTDRRTTVRAGRRYRSKAARGYRYILVDQIRGLGRGMPYALAHEVLPSGERARGDWHGIPRNIPINIALVWRDGTYILPRNYEEVEDG